MAEATRKRIPPLVYIIAAILVAWGVIAVVQSRGAYQPPSGGPAAPIEQPNTPPVMPQAGSPPAGATPPTP